MSELRVRAPATTANLGPGFDCAACALDLWNELVVGEGNGVTIAGEGAGELPEGPENLALRAFALLAPVEGRSFAFANRIPLGRGLGSSAAAVALGLVAGARAAGRKVVPGELLAAGARLEGHADNLAAALAGGLCLTWAERGIPRLARIADGPPLEPVAVIPAERVATAASRAALPAQVSHADASFTRRPGRVARRGRGCGRSAALRHRARRPAPRAVPRGDGAAPPGRARGAARRRARRNALRLGPHGDRLGRARPRRRVRVRPGGTVSIGARRRSGPFGGGRGVVTYRFVDCRWELGKPDAGWELYLAEHIPGAAFLDVERELSAPPGQPPAHGGRHPLPDPDAFAAAAGRAGIGPGVFVVAYDQGRTGGAARLWWLLRHFGHDDVAVLRGGMGDWIGPLRGGEEEIEPREFVPRVRGGDTVDAAELERRLGEDGFVVSTPAPPSATAARSSRSTASPAGSQAR